METQKITNLLNKSDLDSKKFVTRKWYIIDSQTTPPYGIGYPIKFDTKVIKPNLCDYSEAYILVKGNIQNKPANSSVCFKNCAPFRTCSSYINEEFLETAKEIDVTMPMYNLLEYSDNYEDSTGSLYHFKRSEITTGDSNNADITVANSKPFAYRAGFVGDVVNNVELVEPLKYKSNFFRSLEMPLINCKIHLELEWDRNCFLCSDDGAGNNSVTFQITDTKLYAPIITLSTKDTTHLTNLLSEGFKRSIFWNKYKIERHTVDANNNNHWRALLDASFQGVNRLFVLAFNVTAGDAGLVSREVYRKYYLPRVDIKKYNVLIDGRNFYDQAINSQIKKYDEVRKVVLGKGDDYTTGCLLDYAFFKKNDQIIAVDLSKQKELDADPRSIQQIEFIGIVDTASDIYTILEESKDTVLEFFKSTANII